MCPLCHHPADDHTSAGLCQPCSRAGGPCGAAASSPATHQSGYSNIRLFVRRGPGQVCVEMPATTTALYAAKRLAEALGLDPLAREWVLLDPTDQRALDGDEVMGPFDQRLFTLGWR